MYSDAAGTSQITGGYSCPSGTSCYFIFNTSNLVAGQKYFIYITPYGSNSAAADSPTWTNTWMQWRNNPDNSDRLSLVLHYENSITVTYNANGGTGAPSATTHQAGVSSKISTTTPTKSSTTANNYTITFNANGGTANKASQVSTKTTSYTFNKWFYNSGGTGDSVASGGSITPGTSNITLYANYTSSTTNNAITAATATKTSNTLSRPVSFDSNGGSAVSTINSTATESFSFDGWYSSASGGTFKANGGASVTPTATETWYAHWTKSTGSYSAITLPSCTRTGYTFLGWSDGSRTYGAGASYTPSSSITLVAQWERIYQTVSIYKDENLIGTYSVGQGDSFTIPTFASDQKAINITNIGIVFADSDTNYIITIDTPVYRDYKFTNKFQSLNEYGSLLGNYISGNTITVTTDTQLYAQYEQTTDGDYILLTPPHHSKLGYKVASWVDENWALRIGVNQASKIFIDEWDYPEPLYFEAEWEIDNSLKNLYINKNGSMKSGTPYVKHNNVWKPGLISFIRINGLWVPQIDQKPPKMPKAPDSAVVENYTFYGFARTTDGWYENGNSGIDYTCACCKVTFHLNTAQEVVFEYNQRSEYNYDYALFSHINTELNDSPDEDIHGSTSVYRSLKGIIGSGEVSYGTLGPGDFTIYIKYRKDSSVSNYNDSFRFRLLENDMLTGEEDYYPPDNWDCDYWDCDCCDDDCCDYWDCDDCCDYWDCDCCDYYDCEWECDCDCCDDWDCDCDCDCWDCYVWDCVSDDDSYDHAIIYNYGDYGFNENNSTYHNNNTQIDESAACCKVIITLTEAKEIIFTCGQESEELYDYAIFSLPNTYLQPAWDEDHDGSSNVYYSARGNIGIFTVSYDLPAGTHAIYIKYRKDVSVSNHNDYFGFSLNIPSHLQLVLGGGTHSGGSND